MNHIRLTDIADLLKNTNPRYIQSQITGYIESLKEDGISCNTIKFLVAPIFTFYDTFDITLNRKNVLRHLPEFKRVVKDSAYTTEQIQQALQNADHRMRCVILLMASTGCRVGALPSLTLGNLQRLPDYGLYKITFYEGTSSEYYSFCTRECASTGIDNYLEYRKRCGENLAFNQNLNR